MSIKEISVKKYVGMVSELSANFGTTLIKINVTMVIKGQEMDVTRIVYWKGGGHVQEGL